MRKLWQLGICMLGLLERFTHERLDVTVTVPKRLLRELERDRRMHQSLLGTVVQIACQARTLRVRGLDEPPPHRRSIHRGASG